MKLTTSNATVTNTVVSSKLTIGNNAVVESLTVGNVSINSSAIAVGNVSITPAAVSTPSLILGGTAFVGGTFGGIVNYQEFTANGTWNNPLVDAAANASLTGNEQVFVMAWGGGGGGSSNNSNARAGGGGSCALGYYTLSSLSNTVSVTVGLGGANARTSTTAQVTAGTGGNSVFGALVAYGGAGGSATGGGGGGGTFGVGSLATGGTPLPSATSTYGGGDAGFGLGGSSIFGGGGGSTGGGNGGISIYGAAGGGAGGTGSAGLSVFGGNGGNGSLQATSPGGGGYAVTTTSPQNGARGEVRVWVIGPGSTTAGAPTYTLTANTTTLYEGSSVLYTVSTTNVANNTTLYYTINSSSTALANDFTTAVNGSVIITSGIGTFTLTANNDADSANEAFQIDVRTNSNTGTIVASNGSVSIVPFTGGDMTVVSSSTVASDLATISLSAPSGIQQDDLVIVCQVGGGTPVVPAGWTEITFSPASVTSFKSFYKFMGASPDSSVTLQTTTLGIAAVAFALRNANTSPLDGTATATGLNVNDPAAITTTKANSFVIAAGFGYGGFGSITPPAGYSGFGIPFNSGEGISVIYKKLTSAGTDNPGAFTISADDSSTVTFAIKNNLP